MNRPSEATFSNDLEGKLTISVFASFVSLSLAFFYWYSRLGLRDNLVQPILEVLSLGFFLFSLVPCIRLYENHFKIKLLKTRYDSAGLWLAMGLGLLVIFGMVSRFLPTDILVSTVGTVGVMGFSSVFVFWWKSGTFLKNAVFLAMAFFFAGWVATSAWSMHYQSPIYEEQLALGVAHIDALYHASISNMNKVFGLPSLGVNGHPYVGYHFGSHWVFAQFSKLTGIGVLQFYQLGVPLIFDSLQFLALLFLSVDLRHLFFKAHSERPLRSDLVFWLVFLVFEMGFLPSQKFAFPFFSRNHLVSESYSLAITVSLLFVSLLLPTIKNFSRFKEEPNKTTALFVIPVGIGLLCLIKISIGFIFMAVLGIFFLRLKLYKKPIFIASIALCSLISISIFFLTFQEMPENREYYLKFFDLVTTYFGVYSTPVSVVIFFAAPLLYSCLKFRELGIRNFKGFKNAVSQQKILDIEFLFLVCVFGGFFPILFLQGTEALYFADYNRWIGVPLFLGLLGSEILPKPGGNLRKITLLLLIFLGAVILNNGRHNFKEMSFQLPANFQESLDRSPQYHLVQALQKLDQISVAEKKETLLYIPKTNRVYWDILKLCRNIPLVAPALTGFAMLENFSELGCTLGYSGMGIFPTLKTSERLRFTPEEACAKTVKLHFSKVIYLEGDEKNGMIQNTYSCSSAGVLDEKK